MSDKKPELSLDEVLSSIKKMVVDKDPPVLDLTDMVSEDGTIVKVGEGENETPDGVGAFIKLAKEAENEVATQTETVSSEKSESKKEEERNSEPKPQQQTYIPETKSHYQAYSDAMKHEIMYDVFRDIAEGEVRRWLNANLARIVAEKVDRFVEKWIEKNLSRLAGSTVEREIHELLRNRKKES